MQTKRKITPLVLMFLALAPFAIEAQQPNTAYATFRVNNVQGPNATGNPWPYVTTIPLNLAFPVDVMGAPNVPFLGFIGPYAPGWGTVFGDHLDINGSNISPTYAPNAVYIWGNGLSDSYFTTAGSGSWSRTIQGSSPGFSVGGSLAGQAAILDFSSAVLWSLTACCKITWTNPVTQNITLTGWSDDSWQTANFLTFQFPFYNSTRTNCIVSANGYLCWNYGTDDFIPTSSAFLAAMPRCAAFWADLDPSLPGGTVTLSEQITPVPRVVVSFNAVQGTTKGALPNGGNYTFSTTLYNNGDIEFNYAINFGAAQWPQIVGISPGGGAVGTSIDISQTLTTQGIYYGQPNGAIHEAWGASPGPSFDMMGWTLHFYRTGNPPNYSYAVY